MCAWAEARDELYPVMLVMVGLQGWTCGHCCGVVLRGTSFFQSFYGLVLLVVHKHVKTPKLHHIF
jgi:hypothetical protein